MAEMGTGFFFSDAPGPWLTWSLSISPPGFSGKRSRMSKACTLPGFRLACRAPQGCRLTMIAQCLKQWSAHEVLAGLRRGGIPMHRDHLQCFIHCAGPLRSAAINHETRQVFIRCLLSAAGAVTGRRFGGCRRCGSGRSGCRRARECRARPPNRRRGCGSNASPARRDRPTRRGRPGASCGSARPS